MMAYRKVLIQTYRSYGESSSKSVRARPLAGQGLNAEMKVECSSKMRNAHPVGTIFLVPAKVTNKLGGMDFLYTSWQWGYEVLAPDMAAKFIAEGGWRL
jgi:hypothetical protein